MKYISLFIILIWPAFQGTLRAQLDNSFFSDERVIQPGDSGAIKFGLEAFGFLRNNEFKTEIIPGYTLFGYQLRPYFSYSPSNRIRLEAGGFFLKDFGDRDFQEIRPLLSMKYSFRHFSMIFGSLEGGLSHRLIEPVYDFEQVIDHRIEDGIQFKFIHDRWFIDTWIEWLNMIDFGENDQEEFNYGLSMKYQLVKSSDLVLEVPLQLLANHRGGEIDISPEPASTIWNAVAGFGLIFPVREASFLEGIRIDSYYTLFRTSEVRRTQPYQDGEGWFLNVTGNLKWLDLMFSYWHGVQFYAPYGAPLYQSVSYDYPNDGYTEKERDLIYLRVLFVHEFGHGLSLSFRIEPAYDMKNHQMNHSEGLYLRFQTDWLLNRKKTF